jgi:hypothetical protein
MADQVAGAPQQLDDGGLAVLAHVLLQHLSVVNGALALLDEHRHRPPEARAQLLAQATAANERAVAILHDLLRGAVPTLELPSA